MEPLITNHLHAPKNKNENKNKNDDEKEKERVPTSSLFPDDNLHDIDFIPPCSNFICHNSPAHLCHITL